MNLTYLSVGPSRHSWLVPYFHRLPILSVSFFKSNLLFWSSLIKIYVLKMYAYQDKERSEMLEHFRTLTVEATQLGNNNLSLESEARSNKNLLRSAESKIVDLEHIIQNKDDLISSYLEQVRIQFFMLGGCEYLSPRVFVPD